jgi:hypothetical protein
VLAHLPGDVSSSVTVHVPITGVHNTTSAPPVPATGSLLVLAESISVLVLDLSTNAPHIWLMSVIRKLEQIDMGI